MHYLFLCLNGETSNAISYLTITDVNFKSAWNILVSRYENKRCLITVHLQNLVQLPSFSSEICKDQCYLCDQTNAIIQTLKNLDRPVEHWDDVLVFLIAQKFDKLSRKAWELKLGDTIYYPAYRKLDRFLESRIQSDSIGYHKR